MRQDFLLFPLSGGDQARIDAASITATDIAYAAAPAAGAPYPQALRLGFRLTAASPLAQIRPLFPDRRVRVALAQKLPAFRWPVGPVVVTPPASLESPPEMYAGLSR